MDVQETANNERKPNRRLRRISAITGAGLLAGLVAAGLGGVASAQTVITDTSEQVHEAQIVTSFAQVDEAQARQAQDGGHLDEFELDAGEEAIIERFEQCIRDAGLTIDDGTGIEERELDEAAIDAAFESCELILDELEGFDNEVFGGDLSEADEAVFDEYDTCLDSAGLDFEPGAELDDAAIDAAFESCDPILDGLSEDAHAIVGEFEELSEADEAVFDQYDTCLENAGIDFDSEADIDLDEAALDAAFESCDPILDGLSDEAQQLFSCPEDEEE